MSGHRAALSGIFFKSSRAHPPELLVAMAAATMAPDPWFSSSLFGGSLQPRRVPRGRRAAAAAAATAIDTLGDQAAVGNADLVSGVAGTVFTPGQNTEHDVDLRRLFDGGLNDEAVGGLIARQLAVKGFCTVGVGLVDPSVPARARVDAESLDFYEVNTLIAEGLLGPEASLRVADLESSLDARARSDGAGLVAVDEGLTRLWSMLQPHAFQIGTQISQRGNAVVHRAGDDGDGEVPLTEKEVSKWQGQFLRHTLMLVASLGPKAGILELQPYNVGDVVPCQVRLAPGEFAVVRADALTHRFSSIDETILVSCFTLAPDHRGASTLGLVTPVARALEEWTLERLKELKDREEDDRLVWDCEVPRSWQKAMNHNFHRGQAAGIIGAASRFSSVSTPEQWFDSTMTGPDFAVEVPATRWNHDDFYDPDPDGGKGMKTFNNHFTMIEGLELFDNKFFGLSLFEAKSFDPQSRHLLEVGYLSMFSAGLTKKKLMNAPGGIYVGITNVESCYSAGFRSSCGSSGTLCMNSGRISFCLGMKGTSLTVSTDAASSLTVTLLASESVHVKGMATGNDFATALGVHFNLSPVWWPYECESGRMARSGRCRSFDASADGYIRGDGCAALTVKNAYDHVDGELVRREDKFLATVVGGFQCNSGKAASMTAPNSAAEQQVVAEAIRNAAVTPLDVDGVEAFGVGAFLSDAVEVNSIWRALLHEEGEDRLMITSAKTAIGNLVECSGMASMLRILCAAQSGFQTPNVHMRQCNPHLDPFEQPLHVLSEASEFPFRSTFNGAKARGLGGANAFVLAWGMRAQDQAAVSGNDAAAVADRTSLGELLAGRRGQPVLPSFWPGGGGELPRWEKFQIWLDGRPDKVLHPGSPKMPKDCGVLGPSTILRDGEEGAIAAHGEVAKAVPDASSSTEAPTWLLDGRSWVGPELGSADAGMENPDLGLPGDRYCIRLEIAGKWRMVTWEKVSTDSALTAPDTTTALLRAPGWKAKEEGPDLTATKYYVVGSWSDWEFRAMEEDPSMPGLFSLDIWLTSNYGVDFQIVRNTDWDQAFYPSVLGAGDGSSVEVLGPDDLGGEAAWRIEGSLGQRFRIQFQRSREAGGSDSCAVSWRAMSGLGTSGSTSEGAA
mmetsp:Transcript_77772/g.251979  ORF Transcript_77772/g.251979 Transcript_77772/m.251979 type:complete len:1127 (+) Transcript_77772:31-3411(+)